jgi:hypothetical protein
MRRFMKRSLFTCLAALVMTACRSAPVADSTPFLAPTSAGTLNPVATTTWLALMETPSPRPTMMLPPGNQVSQADHLMEPPTPAPTMTPYIPSRTTTPTPTPTPTRLILPTPYASIPASWLTYRNDEYGFTFHYPPSWAVADRFPFSEVTALFLGIQREGTSLHVNVKDVTELEATIGCSGTAAGDTIASGTVSFVGKELPVIRLVYEDKLKTVYFHEELCGHTTVGNLDFFIGLYYEEGIRFDDINLDPAIVAEAVQILATFQYP